MKINDLKMYTSFSQFQMNMLNSMTHADQMNTKALSTGGQSEHYKQLDNPRFFLQNEGAISRIDNYRQTNNVYQQRLQLMGTQIDSMQLISEELGVAIVRNRTSQPAVDTAFTLNVTNWLNNMTQMLNARFSEEFIFSGTSTNNFAVRNLATMPDPGLGALPDFSYYLGDQNAITLQASDSDQVVLNVTARHPAIEQLYHALKLCQNWNLDPTSDRLTEALTLVNNAKLNLASLSGQVSQNIREIEGVSGRLHEQQEYYMETNKLIGFKDQSQILMESMQSRTQLEMSRYLNMRINNDILGLVRSLGG